MPSSSSGTLVGNSTANTIRKNTFAIVYEMHAIVMTASIVCQIRRYANLGNLCPVVLGLYAYFGKMRSFGYSDADNTRCERACI